jgi:hypothetical protein
MINSISETFLFTNEKPEEGILQQFVDPNGDKNSKE